MSRGEIAGVVLAAGSSSRLGTPKQLLRLDNQTLLSRTVRVLSETAVSAVWLTLDARATEVAAEAKNTAGNLVYVPQPELGQSASLHAALVAIEATAIQAVLFTPCDLPLLSSAHLQELINCYQLSAYAIVASAYAGIQGAPLIVDRSLWPELHELQGDTGARSLLQNHPDKVTSVVWPDGAFDIDVPEDWQRLQATQEAPRLWSAGVPPA